MLNAIKCIYEDFSKEELLESYIGGFDQNNHENYNQLLWKICPKIIPSGLQTVELAAHISACVFNEGSQALLQMLEAMGVRSGRNAHQYVTTKNDELML